MATANATRAALMAGTLLTASPRLNGAGEGRDPARIGFRDGQQFRRPVWPGDTLRVRVLYEGSLRRGHEKLTRFSLETANERGEVVLTGRAHSRVTG